ncbi:MAG: TonB-dependent receptor [Saprospiraceae bacterium]|nr:TonB-dependent receptor [Saprospiraceae bacterium]
MLKYQGLLIFLILTLSQSLFAQPPGRGQMPGGGEGFTVKGIVQDENTGIALEYATVSLFRESGELVSGNVSDDKGIFIIKTGPGRFYAEIEYLGYTQKRVDGIRVGPKQPVRDLEVVALAPQESILDEVVVQGERSEMVMGLDKKIFNVGKDLSNRGGNAADLLDNVPSVQVDIEGAVSLRGSGNVRILINGRPSGLIGNDNSGLRSLQANMIDRIEVITNPSARYEAEGMAGIINIILKEERRKGFNGSFDLNAGFPANLGGAFNLNYRTNKVNFFANYGLRYRSNIGNGSNRIENYLGDTTLISRQMSDRDRGGLNNTIRSGIDFFLNDKNTLTSSFTYRIGDDNNFAETIYDDYINDLQTYRTIRTDDEREDETKLEYSLNYERKYERRGQKWTADIRYQDNSEVEGSDLLNKIFLPDGNPSGLDDLVQRSNNKERENSLIFQTDYVLPFSKEKKFETGGRISIRNIDNDFLVEEWFDNSFQRLEGLSNNFQYDERIYAAYLIYGDKKGKFSYQFGLRPEYTDVNTKLLETNEENPRDYLNLFPSGFLSYDLGNSNGIQLSYSRRVRRPRFWDLNPFFTFSDNRNFFSGNPDLDPEFTNSLELGHIKYWDKASINSAIYYRQTDGLIQRIIEFNDDGTTVTMPQNLSSQDSYGLEFNLSLSPVKWWKFNSDFNFFRAITDGGNLGEEFEADTYSWFTRGTSRFSFWKNADAQVRFNYRAPQETTQGRRLAIYTIDLGFSKDFWNDNATLTISVRDLLNSRRRRFIAEGENFYREGDFQWRGRTAVATLNYRLNQKKKRFNQRRGQGDFEGGEQF